MGHVGHAGKGRTTLEVDEDEVELLRRVRHRQREHEGAQELGLAGAGRADDEAVRTHALLGGLLDVERDDLAAAADTDGDPQPVALQPGSPGRGRVEVADVTEAEEVDQLGAGGEGITHLHLTADEHRCQTSRRSLGLGHAHLVGKALGPAAAEAEDLERNLTGRHTLPGRIDGEPQGGRRVEFAPLVGQVEHGDTQDAVVGHERVVAGQAGPVDDDDHVRRGQLAARPETRPVGDVVGKQLKQLVDGLGHETHRPDGIALARAEGVGQPLEPVPLVTRVRAGQGRDDDRVR